jgi:ribosomal protein S18 acetylase RimI-like enzyme
VEIILTDQYGIINAKEKGHQYLELQVWEGNEKANKLYQKNSFQPITQRMVKKL